MSEWHPAATRVPGRSAGPMTIGGPKITLHTTEGGSAAGAIAAYDDSGSWPHFTVQWVGHRLKIYQHLPLSQAGRALEHPFGPETNRANTTQIEMVGFAEHTEDWSDAHVEAIGELCRWIGRQRGCPMQTQPGTKWGVDHPPRLGGVQFVGGKGIHGHQHVPGNVHWDPGEFPIHKMLQMDNEVHRRLHLREKGSDVRALQVAINKRAIRCGRRDRMVDVDGVYGPKTEKNAIWAAYVLGMGTSQKQLKKLWHVSGIAMISQTRIRHPDRRKPIQKIRAGIRRRKHCK